ncbi:hypothetical protein Tco_0392452 [Tanacetum coccineum]
MFRKQNSTVSDYFVAIQGVWIPNAKKCLIISVYAPQEVSEKKMLWSYLNHEDWWKFHHRPILLREVCHDYGPIPFWVFHYWFEWEGFDELVKDTWSKSTITDNNAI